MIHKKLFSGIFLIIFLVLLIILFWWFYLDKTSRCLFLYGKNICNFYAVIDIASRNPTISDFDKMMILCREMTDVPKKDGCFQFIALTFAEIDINKAKEACNQIKGFDNVYSKEKCYKLIINQPY